MAYEASTSFGPAQPVVVVGPQFTVPHQMELTVTKKLVTLAKDSFGIFNVDGNMMFRVKGSDSLFSTSHKLVNNGDHPVVCLRPKKWSVHRKWQIFRRDSSDPKSLLLNVKRSSRKNELDVFLAENTKEQVPDFRIKGSWRESSWTIYHGNLITIIARMQKKQGGDSILQWNDSFLVTVNPNVDYVFILALVMVLDQIHEESKGDVLTLLL